MVVSHIWTDDPATRCRVDFINKKDETAKVTITFLGVNESKSRKLGEVIVVSIEYLKEASLSTIQHETNILSKYKF